MDGAAPGRQYEQTPYQHQRGYGTNISGTGVTERYGPSQTQTRQVPSNGPGASARAHGQGLRVYPYAQGQQQYAAQMQDTQLQYQSEFPQETQRHQQYAPYSSGMIYNIPAHVQPAQQPPSYDPVQHYQPRQSTAIEVLTSQFGVPQYYNTDESTTAATQIPQTYATTQFQQQQQQQQPSHFHSIPSNRAAESSSYASGVSEYSHLNMSNVLEPAESSQDGSARDEPYKVYLDSLKQAYQYTLDGRLVEAGQRLLELSEWLIGNATELGLTKDEPELQSQRLKLWTDFNHCWLAVLQRQKDMTQAMINTSQPPPDGQTLLQEAFLERMASELVRMCDVMERHGLVDYEMGIWEEEIINVVIECLHLLDGDAEEPSRPSSRSNPHLPTRSTN